jgi:hypothetical protein
MDKNEFAQLLADAWARLPQLLNFEKIAAEHSAELERVKLDKARMVESYKAQALSDAKGQADTILEQARVETRKLLADAQERVDAIDAEVRAKVKLRDQVVGDVERGKARLQEYHRVRQALAG